MNGRVDARTAIASRKARQRLTGVVLLPLILFPVLSILSYNWRDISLLHAPPNPPVNLIGVVGAWATFSSYVLLGLGAWLIPVWLLLYAVALIVGGMQRPGVRLAWTGLLTVALCGIFQLNADALQAWAGPDGLDLNLFDVGGLIGFVLVGLTTEPALGRVGAWLLFGSMTLFLAIMAIGPGTLVWIAEETADRIRRRREAHADQRERLELEQKRLQKKMAREQRQTEREARRLERRNRKAVEEAQRRARAAAAEANPPSPEPAPAKRDGPEAPAPRPERPVRQGDSRPGGAPPEPDRAVERQSPAASAYRLPGLDLLDSLPRGGAGVQADEQVMSRIIRDTLSEFGVQVTVTHFERGPVVTRYELLPAPGIRVERIANLASTLELTLKATSVRVQAPIPGKGVVGVEVPNETACVVTVRELLEGPAWKNLAADIPLILGKDVGGKDLLLDLARAPHLLIAGATGSGKSVCINAMLTGLLMSRTPEQVRLMLVDPKIVEFAVFADLPHLVVPVITDPRKVSLGLRWAIVEMQRRYKLMAKAGVRNLSAYNRRPVAVQPELFDPAGSGDGVDVAERMAEDDLPRRLPYIVIVIDELADLMLAAGPEIENSVARLAQLSRAVGIHMILATQRPSVNVITGTIKANFPGRIAFQVAQKVDSRTILDSGGAETLIGRGDMLFLNPWTSKLIRAQGALIQDHEIERVCTFIRDQMRPAYDENVYIEGAEAGEDEAAGGDPSDGREGDDNDEPLLEQAVDIIRETRRASTSSLQRRLRIGYNRAARLMDALEERGIIGPPRGSDPREILIDLDRDISNTGGEEAPAGEPMKPVTDPSG